MPPDNLPVLFEVDEKIAVLRRPRFPKIRDQIADLHDFHAAAKRPRQHLTCHTDFGAPCSVNPYSLSSCSGLSCEHTGG